MNELGSRRYTELVDRMTYTLGLLNKYLELKIKKLQQELGEE